MYEIKVEHTIDAAHRVVGHQNPDGSPGKCARLHGHTYGFSVTLAGDLLDDVGFVVDFAEVKAILDEWDHRCLLWERDPFVIAGQPSSARGSVGELWQVNDDESGVVRLPFNPTAENMAEHLTRRILLIGGLLVVSVEVRETAKTHATVRMTARDLQREAAEAREVGHRRVEALKAMGH